MARRAAPTEGLPTIAQVGPRLSPEARRRHLLDVAAAIVEADGVAALTVESLAERAGVSRGLVYAYFENRAGVLRALWDQVAASWTGDRMPPPAEAAASASSARAAFDERLRVNTRWYFDQIERGGLLFHRLMTEPHLERSVETLRRRIHDDNVAWWAELIELMGVDGQRATVYSTVFNGASEMLWELVAHRRVPRPVIEEVFFASASAALDALVAEHAAVQRRRAPRGQKATSRSAARARAD